MTLFLSGGRAHALRRICNSSSSTACRLLSRPPSATNGQSLDGAGVGADRRKATGQSPSRLVLTDNWKGGLLSRAFARAGLSIDRRRSCFKPAEYGFARKTKSYARQGGRARAFTEFGESHRAVDAGTTHRFVLSLTIIGFLGFATAAFPATAQIAPFDDYSQAPAYYFDKANAGNAEAQFLLGLALEKLGREAQTRWGSAESWIAKAAAAGIPEAQLRYSQIKLKARNSEAATRLLQDAAASGVPEAQFNLGALAEQAGEAKAARRWYWQAARQGYGPARFNLALSLIQLGGEPALTDALSWLILAAENEAPNAGLARDQVKAALDASAIATAEKRANARR